MAFAAKEFDQVGARMLANTEFIPLPNDAGVVSANGNVLDNFLDGRSVRSEFDQFNVRVDRQWTPTDTFYGRFTINDSGGYNPRSFPRFGSTNTTRNLHGTLSYNKVSNPTTLNELRLGAGFSSTARNGQ